MWEAVKIEVQKEPFQAWLAMFSSMRAWVSIGTKGCVDQKVDVVVEVNGYVWQRLSSQCNWGNMSATD